MTQNDTDDSTLADPIDDLEPEDIDSPVETALSIAPGDDIDETLPLVGGGIVLLAAVRSLLRGQRRAIPLVVGGAWLVRYGLRRRGSSEQDYSTFDPIEETDADDSSAGSRIEFTDEDDDDDDDELAADPRDDGDDDVDLSETAMADEAGEATGPDPEQAQPTQTDATEPEATPEEDASDMKVDPDSDAPEADSESGDSSDESETDEE